MIVTKDKRQEFDFLNQTIDQKKFLKFFMRLLKIINRRHQNFFLESKCATKQKSTHHCSL